jgi:hypothetical protein
MAEQRVNQLLAVVVTVIVLAVAWDMISDSSGSPTVVIAPDTTAQVTPPPPPPPPPETRSQAGRVDPQVDTMPGYIEMLARAEARRQIRGSGRNTYLNDIFARTPDSILHRWDNRILSPVRVWLTPGSVANYQTAFLDAVRSAFGRWQEAGIPIRFNLGADSGNAEVRLQWRVQFEIDRTGQTDLTWDQEGHHQSGVITLATFNQLGQPMGVEEIRIVALHEIGHLLGLDHSPDSTDLMYPVARVRDLSARDIQSARLLYQLTPGSIK